MAVERESLIQVGMEVVGSDGRHVGKVKQCRSTDFLVDRRFKRDVFVPFDAVQKVIEDCVVLNVPSNAVSDMPWARPSF